MIASFLILVALAFGVAPAAAGEAAYPPGSRIGLAPPSGMVTSKSFFGYEDPNNNAAIILLALPAQAYAELDKSVTADALQRQGVTFETREALPLPTGKAFLVLGHHEVDKIKIRKWILVAASSTLTALVTVQIPEPAIRLSRRCDPRSAGDTGRSPDRPGRRTAESTAVPAWRARRLSRRGDRSRAGSDVGCRG